MRLLHSSTECRVPTYLLQMMQAEDGCGEASSRDQISSTERIRLDDCGLGRLLPSVYEGPILNEIQHPKPISTLPRAS